MTAGAPSGGLCRAVPFDRDLSGLPHARQVHRVVERAEVVRRVEPAVVRVFMTVHAVLVHHQGLRRDEVAVGRLHLRGEEVLRPFSRADLVRVPRVERVQEAHQDDHHADPRRPDPGVLPLDPRPGQSVPDVEDDRQDRRDQVQPVANLPGRRIPDLEPADPDQDHPRDQQDDG